MNTKEFELSGGIYTVGIAYFQEPIPGRSYGDPEDCYEGEAAEVEFEATVEAPNGETIDFDEFIKFYAEEHSKGDLDKAARCIEDDTIVSIMDGAREYYD